MDDLISRESLYDKMRESEDLARQRVIDTPTSFPNGSVNPAYIRYMAQLCQIVTMGFPILMTRQ